MNRSPTHHISAEGWIFPAEHLPSDNFNERPAGLQPELLVIHNISLPPGQFGGGYVHEFFLNRLDSQTHPYFQEICDLCVSAHLLIERDGRVTQFVPFEQRAWHAGVSSYFGRENCNDFSIGIELEGTDDIPYTDQQYQVLVSVSSAIMSHYPLITPQRVVGHCDIAPGRKTDPGDSFDWARYLQQLQR